MLITLQMFIKLSATNVKLQPCSGQLGKLFKGRGRKASLPILERADDGILRVLGFGTTVDFSG